MALYDMLLARKLLQRSGDDVALTELGRAELERLGIEIAQKSRSPECRACLDWSARQTHLAGSVGRALLARMIELDWAVRVEGTRVVRFTKAGEREFARTFAAQK